MMDEKRLFTIDGFALCHVGIVCAGQQAVSVATNNAFDVAAIRWRFRISINFPVSERLKGYSDLPIVYVEEKALHFAVLWCRGRNKW